MERTGFRFLGCLTALAAVVLINTAQAQDTGGFSGFLQRAGSAVTQTATKVLGHGNAAGPATTTGPYYRPINPATPGQIVGVFDGHRQGAPWPRVAVNFTQADVSLPCWTAHATIWKSMTEHHEETFQVCNAPVAFVDTMGQRRFITAPEDDTSGGQGTLQLSIAQNVQGISHVDTATGDVRNDGPLPPHMLFDWTQATQSGPFCHQYHEVLIRLLWLTGWLNHANPVIDDNAGKTLWIVGFDPANNHDLH